MTDSLYTPWNKEQVKNLIERQSIGHLHEYNCKCGKPLIPTKKGWVCGECDYTQNWCHRSDADGNFSRELTFSVDETIDDSEVDTGIIS